MRGAKNMIGSLAQGLAWVIALSSAAATPAHADPGATDLFSAETLTATADLRLTAVDGEPSWLAGGFGKTRYGADDPGLSVRPRIAEADLIWQPRFTWSLSGTVVATAQEGADRLEPGISEAYLSWKPLSGGTVRLSARAGLMWPPVSLEHSGAEWAVTESITPSAINSWIGEEVKVVGAELGGTVQIGQSKLTLTGALFDMNDTAGALLAFRGWALHDRKAMIFRAHPLPPLNTMLSYVQPRYSHPVIEMDGGYMKRPGYYAKLAWDLPEPVPVHVEYLHYDNASNPEAYDEYMEWGWRTKFDNVGLVASLLPETQLRVQGMSGHTLMGYPMGGARWVDMRFRSGYALLTHYFPRGSVSARVEGFRTRNGGSWLTSQDDEDGWSAMLAARRSLGSHTTVLAEILHVESDKNARARSALAAEQSTTQMQLAMRVRW
jgi:hypothetical protein